jgi:hypothetical protein
MSKMSVAVSIVGGYKKTFKDIIAPETQFLFPTGTIWSKKGPIIGDHTHGYINQG